MQPKTMFIYLPHPYCIALKIFFYKYLSINQQRNTHLKQKKYKIRKLHQKINILKGYLTYVQYLVTIIDICHVNRSFGVITPHQDIINVGTVDTSLNDIRGL